jgi:hypothetical protein
MTVQMLAAGLTGPEFVVGVVLLLVSFGLIRGRRRPVRSPAGRRTPVMRTRRSD